MEDSLRRRRGAGRVDTEGIDSGQDLEPQPEVVANALGQLEQAEAEGLRNPGIVLEGEASPAMASGRRMASSSNAALPISREDEDGLLVDELVSRTMLDMMQRPNTNRFRIWLQARKSGGRVGSATNELELIPFSTTVVLDAVTVRQMHLDMSRLLEQNQSLLNRISQLEQHQRSSTNTSTADGRIPLRGGRVALTAMDSPEPRHRSNAGAVPAEGVDHGY